MGKSLKTVNGKVEKQAQGNAATLPSEDRIRRRAFEIYCARNGAPGDELSDWLAAERELCEPALEHAESIAQRGMVLLAAPQAGHDGDTQC